MALNAAMIRTQLDAVSWQLRDNEAQSIISNASTGDLKSLDDEGVLLLHEALASGWTSKLDSAAIATLRSATQYQPITSTPDYGVSLIKNARSANATVKQELTAGMVRRIYAAENSRLDLWERAGIDGSTVGRGQLGQPAFTDVISTRNFRSEWETCVKTFILSTYMAGRLRASYLEYFDMSNYKVKIPTVYNAHVYQHEVLEDFVVAGYLAVRMAAATKAGRSIKDTARFAVAVYHGMFNMVSNAQQAVNDTVNWGPVARHLIANGNQDEVDYVNEVVP